MQRVLRFRATDKEIFEQVRNGKKWVETRAATVKYRDIAVGDTLVFVCEEEKFERRVLCANIFPDISSLLAAYRVTDIMPALHTAKELAAVYASFPGYEEKIREHGIIAFELKR